MYHVKLSLSGSNKNLRQSIKTLDRTYITYAKKIFSTRAIDFFNSTEELLWRITSFCLKPVREFI